MRVIKTFKDFINEQDGSGGRGVNATKTPPATNTNPKLTTTKDDPKTETPASAAADATAPDQAVMDTLLKMPNSKGSYMHSPSLGEAQPTVENAVSIVIPGTGRNYNFRSKPKTLTVYINNTPDGMSNIKYDGTYEITAAGEVITKSKDGKISETILIATGKLAIDPTTKKPKTTLMTDETSAEQQKGIAQTVAAAIKANSNYWLNSNEDVVYNATEAAFYWIVKNKLNKDQVKEFLATAFTKDASNTYAEMEGFSWGDFGYAPFIGGRPAGRVMDRILEWNPDWASESDEDTAYLKSKVPATNSLCSYEPIGDDAKKWAETIAGIIEDAWVSADEEVNAIMAILVLTPKGLLNVNAAWKDLQTAGIVETKLDIVAAISDEVDSPEAAALVERFAAALMGNPSEGAKKMIELS